VANLCQEPFCLAPHADWRLPRLIEWAPMPAPTYPSHVPPDHQQYQHWPSPAGRGSANKPIRPPEAGCGACRLRRDGLSERRRRNPADDQMFQSWLVTRCGQRCSRVPQRAVHLLSVGLGDLADKFCPRHVHGPVDFACLWPRVVLEDFHHQGRVI